MLLMLVVAGVEVVQGLSLNRIRFSDGQLCRVDLCYKLKTNLNRDHKCEVWEYDALTGSMGCLVLEELHRVELD